MYNYINDDKRPKVNLKFLGIFLAFLVAGVALLAFLVEQRLSDRLPGDDGASASRSEFVGLSPAEIAAGQGSALLVEQRMDAWRAQHPDAQVERTEPVYDGGRLIGYQVTYRD